MTDQKIEGIVIGFQNGAGVIDTATNIHHPYNQIRVQTPTGVMTTWVGVEDSPKIGAEISGTVKIVDTLKDRQQGLYAQPVLSLAS